MARERTVGERRKRQAQSLRPLARPGAIAAAQPPLPHRYSTHTLYTLCCSLRPRPLRSRRLTLFTLLVVFDRRLLLLLLLSLRLALDRLPRTLSAGANEAILGELGPPLAHVGALVAVDVRDRHLVRVRV